MSLLEDALRRQGATAGRPDTPAGRPGVTAPQPPQASRPTPAPPPAVPPPSAPPPAAPPPPAPAKRPPRPQEGTTAARVSAAILPLAILLLILAVAGIALRRGYRAGSQEAGEAASVTSVEGRVLQTSDTPSATLETIADPAAIAPAQVATQAITEPLRELLTPTHALNRSETVESDGNPDSLAAPPSDPPAPPAPPPPDPPCWPLFTVKGIAYGSEQIVILDTGEMLAAGDRSRAGVRVIRVSPIRAWFVWQGATNSLRKGETSDKPPQE